MVIETKTLALPLDGVERQLHRKMGKIDGAIGSVDGFLTPPTDQDATIVAHDFLSTNVDLVGDSFVIGDIHSLSKDGPEACTSAKGIIAPIHDTQSLAGFHVQLQQYYGHIPIYGSAAMVHMTNQRRVHFMASDLSRSLPDLDVTDAKERGLSEEDAWDRIGEVLPLERLETHRRPKLRRVIVRSGKSWSLAWCTDIALAAAPEIHKQDDRSIDYRVFVDVENGDVRKWKLTMEAAGMGRVFHPNPVVTLRQEDLAADAIIPDEVYQTVRLMRLDKSGYLSGRYVDTRRTPNRVHQPNRVFLYDRSHPGFEEVMAYYFVDKVIDWIMRLGWRECFPFPKPLRINAHNDEKDNSKFRPPLWAIFFGDGGVNDAEDASIIVHELGHAIQWAQVNDWGACENPDCPIRAMTEGFGDWLSAVYFAEERHDYHKGWIGDWDKRGSKPPRPYLRRVTEDKTAAHWVGKAHKDGEIWSAALWHLFLASGGDSKNRKIRNQARSTAAKLVLESHYYLDDSDRDSLTFSDGVKALLKADCLLNDDLTRPGPQDELIRDVFEKRGIRPS